MPVAPGAEVSPVAPEAEVSPASLVLLNRDLAVLIVGAASEDAVADVWCCPRLSHRSPASVPWTNLWRVAALAAVCRAWRGAVADYLSQPRGRLCGGCDARSDDLALVSAGVSLAAVHTLRLAGLGLELGGAMAPTLQPAPGCPPAPRALPSFVTALSSLTELALPRCALADADLASLLACASRPLRALSLCGALRAGEYTLRAISVAHGDSLLVLDLGGTTRRVGGALAELRGCKVLRTLELAGCDLLEATSHGLGSESRVRSLRTRRIYHNLNQGGRTRSKLRRDLRARRPAARCSTPRADRPRGVGLVTIGRRSRAHQAHIPANTSANTSAHFLQLQSQR